MGYVFQFLLYSLIDWFSILVSVLAVHGVAGHICQEKMSSGTSDFQFSWQVLKISVVW